ncbi:DELTA-stichotoxin-Hcr4a-like [Osmerus eperlanus]|uniref:DELTA-stichotoxin-Hcr4a-like n=1 Tax=Osmerus eperlanus TaxID=29151 RepID=UPI002E0EA8BD
MSNLVKAVPVSISSRSVTIQITNQTENYTLINPNVWQYSGCAHIDPTSHIKPMESKVCSFIKTMGAAAGCVGVLTYETKRLQGKGCEEILAIMFSVPFDYNLYSNWFAVGIYGHGRACNRSLFKDMYYNKENRFTRSKADSEIMYDGNVLNVKAKMPDVLNTILTLELCEEPSLISTYTSLE